MADQGGRQLATVNTPEMVALDLLQMIAHIEKKALHSGDVDGWTNADRGWVLDTYAECILTIREPQGRNGGLGRAAASIISARSDDSGSLRNGEEARAVTVQS